VRESQIKQLPSPHVVASATPSCDHEQPVKWPTLSVSSTATTSGCCCRRYDDDDDDDADDDDDEVDNANVGGGCGGC
jgi:hypothetical protein